MRDFSKNPRDLRKGFRAAQQRREKVPALIVLDKSREIAANRMRQMEEDYPEEMPVSSMGS